MNDEDTTEIPAEPDKPKGPDGWPSIEQRPPFADVVGEEGRRTFWRT